MVRKADFKPLFLTHWSLRVCLVTAVPVSVVPLPQPQAGFLQWPAQGPQFVQAPVGPAPGEWLPSGNAVMAAYDPQSQAWSQGYPTVEGVAAQPMAISRMSFVDPSITPMNTQGLGAAQPPAFLMTQPYFLPAAQSGPPPSYGFTQQPAPSFETAGMPAMNPSASWQQLGAPAAGTQTPSWQQPMQSAAMVQATRAAEAQRQAEQWAQVSQSVQYAQLAQARAAEAAENLRRAQQADQQAQHAQPVQEVSPNSDGIVLGALRRLVSSLEQESREPTGPAQGPPRAPPAYALIQSGTSSVQSQAAGQAPVLTLGSHDVVLLMVGGLVVIGIMALCSLRSGQQRTKQMEANRDPFAEAKAYLSARAAKQRAAAGRDYGATIPRGARDDSDDDAAR